LSNGGRATGDLSGRSSLRNAGPVLALLALLVLAFAFQGTRGLWEPDEGRYTNIASRMIRSGDFLRPAFNDDFRHFAKPPVTYWAIAAGVATVGWNEWGARIPNAAAFMATVLLVAGIGRRVTKARPWLPAVVYATSLLPVVACNVVTTDTILTLWETLAVLGFVLAWDAGDGRGARGSLLLMWSGFGAAFLTKGPPGLLPLLAIVAFAALSRRRGALRRTFSPWGVALFLAIAASWYTVVAFLDPALVRYFFADEFVGRIASGTHNRHSEWYGAYIYLPILLAGTLPWTPVLLAGFAASWRGLLQFSWWRRAAGERPWVVFCLLWLLLPLAVFAAARSRLPLYVLPLFVPISLLAAQRLEHRPLRLRRWGAALALWCVVLVAGRWAAAGWHSEHDTRPLAVSIAALPPPRPREIVFVDLPPRWGVSLYLRAEVERAVLQSSERGLSVPLDQELAGAESDRLFIVPARRVPAFEAAARELGTGVAQVGSFGDVVYYRQVERDPAAAPRSP